MFNIGAGELAVILVVALLVLGPKRLPELARGLGKLLREFRRQTDEVRSVVEREFYRMDQADAAKDLPRGLTMPAPKPLSRPSSLPYRQAELRQSLGIAGPALVAVSPPESAAAAPGARPEELSRNSGGAQASADSRRAGACPPPQPGSVATPLESAAAVTSSEVTPFSPSEVTPFSPSEVTPFSPSEVEGRRSPSASPYDLEESPAAAPSPAAAAEPGASPDKAAAPSDPNELLH
jgi:sec-independent protein translocase protein TatB